MTLFRGWAPWGAPGAPLAFYLIFSYKKCTRKAPKVTPRDKKWHQKAPRIMKMYPKWSRILDRGSKQKSPTDCSHFQQKTMPATTFNKPTLRLQDTKARRTARSAYIICTNTSWHSSDSPKTVFVFCYLGGSATQTPPPNNSALRPTYLLTVEAWKVGNKK